MYFIFRGLDHRTALAQFKDIFSVWGDLSSATAWQEAFQLLVPFFKKHYTRIVLDDLEHSKSESEVITAIEQLSECIKKLPFDIPQDAKRQYNAVFDYVFQSGSHTVLIKLPESLDWHCTKQELEKLFSGVADYCSAFYEAEICVVSFNKFQQAGQFDNLHLVVV